MNAPEPIVTEGIQTIRVARIGASPTNPRKHFDQAALDELAESIRRHGVLQPILVRPNPDRMRGPREEFEIVSGERRWRAAQAAELREIPALVRELGDAEVLEIQVIENLQRADLHPLEEAEGYEALHQRHSYTVADIAAKVGKSERYVYARMKLCALCEKARKAFYAGKLTPTTALLVARIPDAGLQAKATAEITEVRWQGADPMSARQASEHIQRTYMLRLATAPFSTTDVELVPEAGPCTTCPKRTGNAGVGFCRRWLAELKALAKQVHAGKASYEGGYFAGFDHCDPREVEDYTTYAKPFRQLGLEFPRTMLETAVTAHYRQGGIDVDTATMRSSVPGLYVAGGVGGHSNGLIALATYDGHAVAHSVANDLSKLSSRTASSQDIAAEERRLTALRETSGKGHAPVKLKEKLREMMWHKAGVEKNAGDLKSALADIEEMRSVALPDLRITHHGKSANYEWLDAIDLVNMLDACGLIVQSSLERKESRGPFFRQDFPLTDNAKWLCANVLKKAGNSIRFEQRPYDLPFFEPGFQVKNNFEVPW